MSGEGASDVLAPQPIRASHDAGVASTADFSFPLNVYARMLELDEGRLDYLHYGLFERPDEPVWRAQERASQRLWAVLPAPCRVLEVGIGVGTTLRRLAAAGYHATGITPDAAQVAEVRRRLGDGVDLRVSTLEALAPGAQPHQLMLLQESAQYIEPLALFEAADRLLADDAHIVVMDEFAWRRTDAQSSGLHLHAHFVALARRMGWAVEIDQDVTALAAPTVDAIDRLVQRQRPELRTQLALTDAQLDELGRAAQVYRTRYRNGDFVYRVMRLRRAARPALRLGAVGPAQSGAMRVLFERVFERPMSQAEWAWKYAEGRGCAVGLWRGDRLVAHYGASTRPVRFGGQTIAAAQVGDVMVVPEANGGIGRQGALQQVSATLLEQQIGWGTPHPLAFGFPNARAMRVAERLALYGRVDEVIQLEWDGTPAASRLGWWRVHEVDVGALREGSSDWMRLLRAWRQMADSMPQALLPVRDPEWLQHRYGRRPGVHYRVYLARPRWGGDKAAGAFVLREHGDHAELMDVVGAAPGCARLARLAAARAAALGHNRLCAWVTRSHAALLDDARRPARRVELGVQVPCSVHTPGPGAGELAGRWFLMGGDTDFR